MKTLILILAILLVTKAASAKDSKNVQLVIDIYPTSEATEEVRDQYDTCFDFGPNLVACHDDPTKNLTK